MIAEINNNKIRRGELCQKDINCTKICMAVLLGKKHRGASNASLTTTKGKKLLKNRAEITAGVRENECNQSLYWQDSIAY